MADVAIFVEGLTKRFGTVQALAGVDFEVPAGTIFGLLGPNGAGKTTTVRILSTIIQPDAGRAEVLGYDVVRNERDVRYRIGLAGQFAAVDPNLTGRENLRLMGMLTHIPRSQIFSRADELLERFGLTAAAHRTVRTYSGGMRRRLDLAAALVHRPPVLFLDEPTTGLDPHGRRDVWDMIRELVADGTTVLLTTQYLEEAEVLASTVAVVDDGKIIAMDAPEVLKTRLGSTVIELGWPSEAHATRAEKIIEPLVPNAPERDGTAVRFASTDGPKLLIGVLRTLDSNKLTPSALAVREPSLDDVFVALTGRHAERAAEQPAEQQKKKRRAR